MVELFPHQAKAVKELGNGKILWGDVGTGKTLTAMAYYMEHEKPRDVYVITTAKKRDSLDWQADAAKYGVSTHKDVGEFGTLTVDSWNNIEKYIGVKDAFFIFDEQRLVGTGKWVKSFYKIAHNNRWILLTATPGDTWLDYAPVFIANGWYKNITEFRGKHVVYSYHSKFPKVERYIATGTLVRLRNSILVEMPYLRHTTRTITDLTVPHDEALFKRVVKDQWHPYEERPIRDMAEQFLVMRKVVNSDDSRTQSVRELLKIHPRLIVFYNFDYELEALRKIFQTEASSPSLSTSEESEEWQGRTSLSRPTSSLTNSRSNSSSGSSTTINQETRCDSNSGTGFPVSSGSLSEQRSNISTTGSTPSNAEESSAPIVETSIAEWNGHKHEPIPETDSWLYLVQYRAGAEGWNCTATDAMCFYSLTYSFKDFYQAQGRIDRLNTPYSELHYYVLVSKSAIDQAIRKALKGKRNFNESAFASNTRWGLAA